MFHQAEQVAFYGFSSAVLAVEPCQDRSGLLPVELLSV
jgi:hypothetical protein